MRKHFWQESIFAFLVVCLFQPALSAVEIEWDDRIPRGGAELKARVFVKDCEGKPVEEATVGGHFVVYSTGRVAHDVVQTDVDGYAVVHGNSDEYDYALQITKEGWYESRDNSKDVVKSTPVNRFGVKAGKWFPYAQKHEIVLKEIRKPIPMVCFDRVSLETPEPDKEYGYDLEYGSLVEPYGDGKVADFYVKFTRKESESQIQKTVIFSFPNELDGAYVISLDMQSQFASPYHADLDATYSKEFIFKSVDHKYNPRSTIPQKDEEDLLRKDQGMILRTRTVVDENGTLVSAHYSKIYGGGTLISTWITGFDNSGFTTFFNPMENDTNLEFDNKYHPVQKGKNSPRGLLEKW